MLIGCGPLGVRRLAKMSGDYVCRVCEAAEDLEILFKKENENLIDMLKLILDVPVEPDDYLPQCICANCIQRLNQAYKFKLKFLNTDQKLRNAIPVKPDQARVQENENAFIEDIPIKEECADTLQKTDELASEIIVKEEVIFGTEYADTNVNQQQNEYFYESIDDVPPKLKRKSHPFITSHGSGGMNARSNQDRMNQVTAKEPIDSKRARKK